MSMDEPQPSQPRYRVLAHELRTRIADGAYPAGARLPTEAEWAQLFDVSRGTVIKAIDVLVSEGIVTKRQGAGSFVSQPTLHRRSSRLQSFSRTVDAQGHRASQRVLSFGQASIDDARAFGILEPAAMLVRLRLVDGVPCAIHRAMIPQRILDMLPAEILGQFLKSTESDFSLYAAFENANLEISSGSEHVTARLATDDEAETLHIAPPAALIIVVRKSFDAAAAPVEATEAIYNANYYSYELDLVRTHAQEAPQRLSLAQ